MRKLFAIVFLFPVFGVLAVASEFSGSDGFSGFRRSLNDTSYGYEVRDPLGSAGAMVERFEVRSGDCGHHDRWSDY